MSVWADEEDVLLDVMRETLRQKQERAFAARVKRLTKQLTA